MQDEKMISIVLYNKDTGKVVARWQVREEDGKVILDDDGERVELPDGSYKVGFFGDDVELEQIPGCRGLRRKEDDFMKKYLDWVRSGIQEIGEWEKMVED